MNIKSLVLSATLSALCFVTKAQINMSNTTSTITASTLFYDNGGSSANYGNSQNLTHSFTTSLANHRIKVLFSSFNTYDANDSLSIYNGSSATVANFMGKHYATVTPPSYYSTSNSLTFRFVSDANNNAAGWVSTVSPFGISALSNTVSSQSSVTTFNITGFNTDWTSGISGIYLVHSVTNASVSATTYTAITATQIQATFNIPCNADLGLYELRIIQPTIGLTSMPNAFNVTPFSLSLGATNSLCFNNPSGSLTSTVTGGTAAYSYYYAPGGQSTPTVGSLSGGTYTLTVTDANSCTRTQTATISEPPPLSTGYPNSQSICSGQSAVLTMTASGGVAGYTYTWTGPNLSSNNTASTQASPLSASTYTYSVHDANSCVSTSTLIVTVNPLPTVNTSASPSNICPGASSTLSVTGSAATYSWNTGSTNNTVNVSPASTTVYTVTGTDGVGCAQSATVGVTVNPSPVISATTNTPLCAGGNLVFVNNSTGATAYSWTGPASFSSSLMNPSIPNLTTSNSGTYTLSAVSGAGCTASGTIGVNVNTAPSLTLTSNVPAVCAGSTVSVQGTGAVSYTWMPGSATGASQTFTLTSATVYTATGTDANGCTGSNGISIGVNALTAISGTATVSSSPVAGQATLYHYEPFLTKFDSVTTQNLSGTGAYNFASVPAGSYIVKATPSASSLQVTYGSSAIGWKNATVTNHDCISGSTQNISVIPFSTISAGPGSLSGAITQTVGYGQRSPYSPLAPGQPIKGVTVKGGKNPGGNMFAQTTTAADGTYTLSGLPVNAPGESYFILVDIAGLDTNGTYHRVVSNGSSSYSGLNFTVDSARINPVPSQATGLSERGLKAGEVGLYPNPAHHSSVLTYRLDEAVAVSIEIRDVTGRLVRVVMESGLLPAGYHHTEIPIDDLEAGLYFIRLKSGTGETTLRLVAGQ